MGATEFSFMVHDINLRSKFVRTAVEFLKKNKFDGLGNFSTIYINEFQNNVISIYNKN